MSSMGRRRAVFQIDQPMGAAKCSARTRRKSCRCSSMAPPKAPTSRFEKLSSAPIRCRSITRQSCLRSSGRNAPPVPPTVMVGALAWIPRASGSWPAPKAPMVTGPAFWGQVRPVVVQASPRRSSTRLPAVAYPVTAERSAVVTCRAPAGQPEKSAPVETQVVSVPA